MKWKISIGNRNWCESQGSGSKGSKLEQRGWESHYDSHRKISFFLQFHCIEWNFHNFSIILREKNSIRSQLKIIRSAIINVNGSKHMVFRCEIREILYIVEWLKMYYTNTNYIFLRKFSQITAYMAYGIQWYWIACVYFNFCFISNEIAQNSNRMTCHLVHICMFGLFSKIEKNFLQRHTQFRINIKASSHQKLKHGKNSQKYVYADMHPYFVDIVHKNRK